MTETYLASQAALHPAMQPRDAIKLLFQAAFGAEHLLRDTKAAEAFFQAEWDGVPETDEALYEPIDPQTVRVNLGAWKAQRIPAQWLFSLFVQGAQEAAKKPRGECEAAFFQSLDSAGALAQAGALPFTADAWQSAVKAYRQEGLHAVHHSAVYRESERPAYRVVPLRMARLTPVFQRLCALNEKMPVVLALDGRAASGKTTAAQILCRALETDAVHMDDFFLPPSLRTPERLAQAGGNIHYERFAQEVLPQLKSQSPFCYTAFDCSRMDYGHQVSIAQNRIRIVEGSYSHHPRFDAYADLRVFFDVEPQEQLARIRARNGEESARVFQDRWIPMEERYFRSFCIAEKADVVIR